MRADPFHERQAKPQTLAARQGAAYEGLEYLFLLVGGNSDAGVLDAEPVLFQNKPHFTLGGIMQRVAEQIRHDRTQEGRVVAC